MRHIGLLNCGDGAIGCCRSDMSCPEMTKCKNVPTAEAGQDSSCTLLYQHLSKHPKTVEDDEILRKDEGDESARHRNQFSGYERLL